MLTLTGFACTEDEIHYPTEEETTAYKEFGDDLQTDARALLATVRHLLTGREIAMLEAASDIETSDGVDVYLLPPLQTQFSREIAEWKAGVKAS